MFIALTDLLEAEGRALRIAIARLGMGLACIAGATLLVVSGLGLLLWAAYLYLAQAYTPVSAALICGLFLLLLATLLAWTTRRLIR